MAEITGKITKRLDGGYDVIHNGYPYGPITESTEKLYTYAECVAYAEANPTLLVEETATVVTLAELQTRLCGYADDRKDTIMSNGFTYDGGTIQADSEAQANLSAWVLLNSEGMLTFPKLWRKADNTFLTLADSAALLALASAMATFKDSVYTSIFTVKDAIRAATTKDDAQALYDAWLKTWGLS